MQDFLDKTIYGNSVSAYLIALGIFIVGVIVLIIFKKWCLSRIKQWTQTTESKVDDFLLIGVEKSVIPASYILILYFAIRTLKFPEKVVHVINVITVILVTFFVLRVITSTLRFSLTSYIRQKTPADEAERKVKQIKGITLILSFIIWTVGGVFLLDNLGFEISAVIAGLGVGGIAIALAAQAILGDLFSYFVIFFDRPFEIGDFVVLGDFNGTIEHIGIKTTRIRSLSGEQVIVSNTDLTNSRIRNFKRMEQRRVVFKLGVIYQTSVQKLAEIPQIVKKIIEEQSDTRFDRAHFQNYGDSSINFEFVYYVLSSEYNKYMDIQQAINLRIYEQFEQHGIEFAYPTQTLFGDINVISKKSE